MKWTMNTLMLRRIISACCLLSISAVQAQSTEDPWFEIELIAFERTSLSSTLEKFNDSVTPIALHRSLDLLKPLYQPQIRALYSALPLCAPAPDEAAQRLPADLQIGNATSQPWFDEVQLAEQSLQQFSSTFPPEPLLQWPLACKRPPAAPSGIAIPQLLPDDSDMQVAGPAVLPVIPPLLAPVAHQNSPYLVDESSFLLKDLAWQLSHRANHTLLLHTAWRQPLGVKRRSTSLRFFAGQRFSPQFDYQGLARNPAADLTSQADLDSAVEHTYQQLQQQQQLSHDSFGKQVVGLPQQVWQLDGLIQPYNERMLFADTEFNLRQRVPGVGNSGDRLQTFYVKDNVRLLLGEIHYLDHPRFGLILQIRRFTPPATPIAGEGVSP